MSVGRRVVVMVLAAVACGGPLRAHDFWIEPATFTPEVGRLLPVGLRVGERFQGEPVPRRSERIDSFIAVGPGGERPVSGEAGAEPAGALKVDSPGVLVIGYRGRQQFIELDAAKFEAYLAEEGLQRISALRAERGQKGSSARELYSRCAKAVVAAGGGGSRGHDRVLGFPLELVPEASPYNLGSAGRMPVRLIFRGRPLEGAEVEAINREEPARALTARTDAEGRASFELPRPGIWLIKSVHMFEAPDPHKADWESLWASLTFEVPAPAAR